MWKWYIKLNLRLVKGLTLFIKPPALLNEKLDCKKNGREETLSHGKHVIEVFKKNGIPIVMF